MKTRSSRQGDRTIGGALSAVAIAALVAASGVIGATPATAAESLDAANLVEVDRPGTSMISAAPFDVGSYGYEELEYFSSGEGDRYLDAGEVFGGSRETLTGAEKGGPAGDYNTRVIVRRPSAEKFNGTLVVEWTNVTAGQDGEFVFGEAYDTLLSEGYAYATVSVQSVGTLGSPDIPSGVANLVSTLPERYGDLEVDPDCTDTPCPPGTLSWDIIGETAKALKDSPDSPLAGLGVEKVIATGQSQSAGMLATYYNKIQPIHQFFDGFVLYDGGGVSLRTDLSTPAIQIKAEISASPPSRPETGPFTRVWQAAGLSHGSYYIHQYMDQVFTRDGTQPNGGSFTDWLVGFAQCTDTNVGTKVHVGQVIGGAISSVDTWSRSGAPAAATTFFELEDDGSYSRDDRGLIEGGVQIADAAVPTSWFGATFNGRSCGAAGFYRDYTEQELEQLYVSHEAYLTQVTDVTRAALAHGYIVASDAAKTIAAAAGSDVAETDISLTGSSDVPGAFGGTDVTLSVAPSLDRGAWLEDQGTKVPVIISGKASFTRTGQYPTTTTIWQRDLPITNLDQVEAGVLTLPRQSGTVSITWCIDVAKQDPRFAGHVNETCTRSDLPNVTIDVRKDDRATATLIGIAKPTVATSSQPVTLTVWVAPRSVDAEGDVTATIGGQSFTGTLNNNKAMIPIGTLSPGIHRVTLTYAGSDTVKPASGRTVVIVPR